MRKEIVAVVCTALDGSPAIPIYTVYVTEEEYDLGIHYDKAEIEAINDRFEGPYTCFDNSEHFEIFGAADRLRDFRDEYDPKVD
jgi:hypothetical protein